VEVSERFRVGRRTVARPFGQYEQSGDLSPKQIGGYRRSRLADHAKVLGRWIDKKADVTLVQLQERCRKKLGVKVGVNALWHQLRRMGLSSRKTTHAAEQDRPDVAPLAPGAARLGPGSPCLHR
jgi:transposase